jgi:hypothetical protein
MCGVPYLQALQNDLKRFENKVDSVIDKCRTVSTAVTDADKALLQQETTGKCGKKRKRVFNVTLKY